MDINRINLTKDMFGRYYKKALSFFCSSLAGVTVDLVVFQLLIYLHVAPFYASMVSSGLAIVTTYFFVVRYTFIGNKSTLKFILFCLYYALSITFFSYLIAYIVIMTGWSPLACKICSLPFSFLANFLFSYILLRR